MKEIRSTSKKRSRRHSEHNDKRVARWMARPQPSCTGDVIQETFKVFEEYFE